MKLLARIANHAVSVRNVLFATDFSPTSEAALPYAVAISRRYGSTLHAVHVVEDVDLLPSLEPEDSITAGSVYETVRTAAKEKMEEMAVRFHDLPHHTYLGHGRVSESISSFIRTHHIDLLVVGTRGRTGVEKLMLGSIAEEMLRRASCPVLTVGPEVSGRAKLPSIHGRGQEGVEIEIRQIIHASDFTPCSTPAAAYAISLAQEFQSHLTLLHVMEKYVDLDRRPGPIQAALQRLEDMVPRSAALWCTPEPVVEFGAPAEHILRIASERKADLIVLGARLQNGSLGVVTHLPWATAHKVIAHAHCPVLTVPGSGLA